MSLQEFKRLHYIRLLETCYNFCIRMAHALLEHVTLSPLQFGPICRCLWIQSYVVNSMSKQPCSMSTCWITRYKSYVCLLPIHLNKCGRTATIISFLSAPYSWSTTLTASTSISSLFRVYTQIVQPCLPKDFKRNYNEWGCNHYYECLCVNYSKLLGHKILIICCAKPITTIFFFLKAIKWFYLH